MRTWWTNDYRFALLQIGIVVLIGIIIGFIIGGLLVGVVVGALVAFTIGTGAFAGISSRHSIERETATIEARENQALSQFVNRNYPGASDLRIAEEKYGSYVAYFKHNGQDQKIAKWGNQIWHFEGQV